MRLRLRPAGFLVLVMAAITCTDAPTGPGKAPGSTLSSAHVRVSPSFSPAAATAYAGLAALGIEVTEVHVHLSAADGMSRDTTINFAPGQETLVVDIPVTGREVNQTFTALIELRNDQHVVLFSGAQTAIAYLVNFPAGQPPLVILQYTGPGSRAKIVTVTPSDTTVSAASVVPLVASAVDSSGSAVSNPLVMWATSDATIATVTTTGNAATVVTGQGRRGTVTISASTLTGLRGLSRVTLVPPAAHVVVVSGGGQTGVAGSVLAQPLVVEVQATDNLPVPGTKVTFRAVAVGGAVQRATVITDGAGRASTALTLGRTGGSYQYEATTDALTPVSVSETATPAPPAAVAIVSGDQQLDSVGRVLALPLVVRVTDEFGGPASGATVAWSRVAGTGSVGAASTTSTSNGLASTTYTLGTAVGTETVSATLAGVSGAAANAVFTLGARSRAPSVIAIVSGGNQSGTPKSTLPAPLVARVTDAFNNPIIGVSVTWRAPLDRASFSPTTSVTDANGQVTTRATLGLIAASVPISATTGVVVGGTTLTIVPGAATTITKVAGDAQSALVATGVGTLPSVKVADDAGNPVSAAPVIFAVATGGGIATGLSASTNAAGIASVGSWTLGTAPGPNTMTATSGVLSTIFSATSSTGSAARLLLVQAPPSTITVGAPVPAVTVQLADALSNPVGTAGVVITAVAITQPSNFTSTLLATTDAAGVATFAFTPYSGPTGAASITFNAPGVATLVSSPITIAAGAANKLVISVQPPSSAVSGVSLSPQPVLQVVDAGANPVSAAGIVVTAQLATGGGTLTGAQATSNAAGVVSFTSLVITGGSAARTINFSSAGLISVTSNTIGIGAGRPASLAKGAGDAQTATVGTIVAVAPSVVVTDAAGNPVSGVAVTFTAVTAGSSVSDGSTTGTSVTSTTTVAGVAQLAGWTLSTTTGTNALIATAGALTATFTATGTAGAPGSPVKVAGTDGQSATVGAAVAIAPAVRIADGNGNPVQGVNVVFAVASGGGSVTGASVTSNVNGIATVGSWTLGTTASANSLTATAPGGVATFTARATAGIAATIVKSAGDAQSAIVGTAVVTAPKVLITDSQGNPVSGVSVTFAVASGGGSVTSAVQTTDASGLASVGSWTLGTVTGANSLTATAGSLTVTFTATATAGAPGSPVKVAGTDGQSATVGTAVATAPAIRITDSNGNPVAGIAVSFAVTSGGGAVTGASATTNASGVATVGSWTLGTTAGTNQLTATAPGGTTVVTATGIAGAPTNIAKSAGDNQSAVAGNVVGTASAVKITDAQNNPVAGVTVTFAVASGGGTVTGGTAPTSASGIATVGSWTLGTVTGANSLTATAGSLTVTFTATATAGAPGSPVKVAGTDAQSATVGTAVATAPAVRIADGNGNPVAGVAVSFAVTSGGGAVTGASATTNASGVATVGSWTLGTTAGTNALTATTPGGSTVFAATGTSQSFSTLILTTAPATTLQNNVVIPDLSVQLANGTTAVARPGVVITATATRAAGVTSGSVPALLAGTTSVIEATTNANGIATFSGMRAVATVQDFALHFGANTTTIGVNSSDIRLAVGPAYGLKKTAGDIQVGLVSAALPTAARVQLVDTLAQETLSSPATTVSFSTPTGGGSASPSAGTNTSGFADATWVLGAAEGTNTLLAQATVAGVARTVTFTATAVDAHSMSFSATPASSQTSGVALSPQPSIQLLDGNGSAVQKSGVVITASVAPAPSVTGASFAPGGTITATTDATGRATFTSLAVSGTSGQVARLTFAVTSGTANTIAALTTDLTLAASLPSTAETATALAVSSTVGNALASSVYPTVRVRDASGNIVSSAANTSVTFSVTNGACSVSGQPVSINANGVAALSASTLTLPSSAGSCVIHAVTSPALTGSPFDFRVVAAPTGAFVWSGATDDDFSSASNWIGGSAPTSSSAIYIPRFMLRSPKMQGSTTVATFAMESGGSFDVGSANTLSVTGTVDAGTVSNGAVNATGSSATIRGTFSSVALTFGDGTNTCAYTLNGPLNVVQSTPATSGNVSVSNCNVDVSTQTLTVGRDLTVAGTNGRVVMQNSSSKVSVAGSASFAGAATDLPTNTLTNGSLEIGGNFAQSSNVSSSAFVASGSHTTKLIGTAAQSVNFANPTTSHFYNLNVTNASSSGTTITSIVDVKNDFTLGTSGTSAKLSGNFSGGGTRLIVDGAVTAFGTADLGALDSLEVTSNTFPSFANTTAGKAPKITKLTGSNVSLNGNATVSGGLGIGSGASLTIGIRTLTLKDSLIVDGTLDMSSSSGQTIVGGLARFRGGSSGTHIQAGTLKVGGNFFEEGSSQTTFAPASGFLVQLNGTSSQDVKFDHPGSTSSRFGRLDILNTSSSGVGMSTDIRVTGDLEQKGTLTVGSGRTTTVDGIAQFRNGAKTVVTGTMTLATGNFYDGSSTTGAGTLSVVACSYSVNLNGANLFVGGGLFNVTTCSNPGRVLP